MKVAIISDVHDNLTNLEKFLALAKELKIEGIICCGDVTTPETLELLAERFLGPIKLACGNMEIRKEEFSGVALRHKNLEVFPEIGHWNLGSSKADLEAVFVHRPGKTEELAHSLKGKSQLGFVFYGHTHRPWIGQIGEILVANPGTLGGVFMPPTFAVLDTETAKLELKRLF